MKTLDWKSVFVSVPALWLLIVFGIAGCASDPTGDGGQAQLNQPAGAVFYQFGFEDGTNGRFLTGGQQDPRSQGWKIDQTDAAEGVFSIWWDFTANGDSQWIFYFLGNEGDPPVGRSFYVGFFYRLSADWTHRPTDQSKVLRFKDEGFANAGSLVWSSDASGNASLRHSWDKFNPGFSLRGCNIGAPCEEDEFRSWHFIEVHQDISDPSRATIRLWVDGQLRMEYIDDLTALINNERWASFEFNGSHEVSAGREFMDLISLSTTRINP